MIYPTSSERLSLLSVSLCICPLGFYIVVRLVCMCMLRCLCVYIGVCLDVCVCVCVCAVFFPIFSSYIKSYINTKKLTSSTRDKNKSDCQTAVFSNTLLVDLRAERDPDAVMPNGRVSSGRRNGQTRPVITGSIGKFCPGTTHVKIKIALCHIPPCGGGLG